MALSAQDRAAQVAIFGEDWVKQLEMIQAGDFAGAGKLKPNNAFAGVEGIPELKNQVGNAPSVEQTQADFAAIDKGQTFKAGVNQALAPVENQLNAFSDNSAVQSNVDPAFRQYQLGLAAQLQQQATGQGPSLAQMQLKQATDQTLSQSLGAIRSATGANAGLAARSASLLGAQQLGSAANQSGMLRLQEQQQAQAALANLSAQGRSGDIGADSNAIQAQTASNNAQLGALNGLTDIGIAKANPYGNIYATESAAVAQDKDIAAQQALAAQQQAAQRAAARRAATSGMQNQALGAAFTIGGAALGTLVAPGVGTAAGAAAGSALAGQSNKQSNNIA